MQLLENQFKRNLPFAAYREPGAREVTVLMQHDRKLCRTEGMGSSGFILAPFLPGGEKMLLRPDAVCTIDSPAFREIPIFHYPSEIDSAVHKNTFIKCVEKAREKIVKGVFEKVVLSRKLQLASGAHPVGVFRALLQAYPDAFCYLWYHPVTGSWLGASPELLLGVKGDNFTTSALAGTQKYRGTNVPQWSRKELQEQRFVTDYIRNILKAKTQTYQISDPESVRAGGLWHLRSTISGTLGKYTVGELLGALHPTPAVGGLPLRQALEFIAANEGYDRSYYTGYLGVVSGGNSGAPAQSMLFYVNLRCMHMQDGVASVYVGAGITEASVPDQEWKETCDKAGTMLCVLFNSVD